MGFHALFALAGGGESGQGGLEFRARRRAGGSPRTGEGERGKLALMKFLVDVNASRAVARWLTERGHACYHAAIAAGAGAASPCIKRVNPSAVTMINTPNRNVTRGPNNAHAQPPANGRITAEI